MATTHIPYIWHNGTWHKAKPIIIKITNMGPIPSNALLANDGIPFLTKSKEFFLVSSSTPNLTATSSTDYLRYEELKYTAKIF